MYFLGIDSSGNLPDYETYLESLSVAELRHFPSNLDGASIAVAGLWRKYADAFILNLQV